MNNLNYYSFVNVEREEGLSNIKNGVVKSFFKATSYDQNYFDEIECEVIKEILVEEHNLEIEERKNKGSKRLTKLKLIECLPEDATHVSVNFNFRSSINKIENITSIINDYELNSKEKIIEKHKDKIKKIDFYKDRNPHQLTIWSI